MPAGCRNCSQYSAPACVWRLRKNRSGTPAVGPTRRSKSTAASIRSPGRKRRGPTGSSISKARPAPSRDFGRAPRCCGTTSISTSPPNWRSRDVWATLTEHDSVIFRDNDFEVFLNPSGDGRNYFEFEINALNTGWDLFLPKPYREGGKADNSWEIPGLRTAVHVNGTLNDPRDRDRGWTVEIAFPWSSFASRAPVARPKPGDEWRINFSRVEWHTNVENGKYVKPKGEKEDNWVWSPQGLINMHVPDRWGFVRFSR